jgi:hypothetical protein
MLTKIYHKKNELLQVEFYQDWKCQQAFDFMDKKDLYIELKKGDCTPIFRLSNKLWSLNIKANIFTPTWYLGLYDGISPQTPLITLNDVLDDIDLSKYIPKDNAVLFLSEEDCNNYKESFCNMARFTIAENDNDFYKRCLESGNRIYYKKLTIFLTHGTESELQKANEIAEELKEKYGIDEVNLFVLHLFREITEFYEKIMFYSDSCLSRNIEDWHNIGNINKIIATNSMPVVFQKRLQILDCYDIFNNYLKGE